MPHWHLDCIPYTKHFHVSFFRTLYKLCMTHIKKQKPYLGIYTWQVQRGDFLEILRSEYKAKCKIRAYQNSSAFGARKMWHLKIALLCGVLSLTDFINFTDGSPVGTSENRFEFKDSEALKIFQKQENDSPTLLRIRRHRGFNDDFPHWGEQEFPFRNEYDFNTGPFQHHGPRPFPYPVEPHFPFRNHHGPCRFRPCHGHRRFSHKHRNHCGDETTSTTPSTSTTTVTASPEIRPVSEDTDDDFDASTGRKEETTTKVTASNSASGTMDVVVIDVRSREVDAE